MTSCWSKISTGKQHPYFWCKSRGCSEYRKSTRAEKVDTGFEVTRRSNFQASGAWTFLSLQREVLLQNERIGDLRCIRSDLASVGRKRSFIDQIAPKALLRLSTTAAMPNLKGQRLNPDSPVLPVAHMPSVVRLQ